MAINAVRAASVMCAGIMGVSAVLGSSAAAHAAPAGLARPTAAAAAPNIDIQKDWGGVTFLLNQAETRRIGGGSAIGGAVLGVLGGPLTAAALGIGAVSVMEMASSGYCLNVRYSWASLVTHQPQRVWWRKC
ncbi:hypothetical protein G6045_37800 [Streptomyces sp. YC504]|uniref:Uncharacterized protein n=1 Tax=Streptomyces mesophilus TaxID=1775132 RepID=A0A6G4XXF8_9ACTN|nr:hypothetical protein [Streptomyces mesophilus]NGO81374.1 hypothetical protein [Streptomyces mesophilus]